VIRLDSLDRSDKVFLKTMLKSGTLGDKVSALTLLAHESPMHNFSSLTELVEMTKKKSKKEAIMTVEAVKDLMIGKASKGSGLLPERKLT
jgi:ribosome biogenesis protein MAK21